MYTESPLMWKKAATSTLSFRMKDDVYRDIYIYADEKGVHADLTTLGLFAAYGNKITFKIILKSE